jgi:hypothetical protein
MNNIMSSQWQFENGKINDLGTTIINIALLFSTAIGRPSPLPFRRGGNRALNVKDQMLRELIFSLLSAAAFTHGEFTMDKNRQTGTLLPALDLLRTHLPKGLVPNALPVGTIQKLKSDFFRLNDL